MAFSIRRRKFSKAHVAWLTSEDSNLRIRDCENAL
jgi:hypothetical protein